LNFSTYIARRYTISLSKSTAVNSITAIATLGILVGTAALSVILSVFSGLRDFSLSFTNATDPDLKMEAVQGKSFMLSPEQKKQLAAVKGIAAYSGVAEERVLFYFDGKEQVTFMKGIDSLYTKVTGMSDKKILLAGQSIEPKSGDAVVGAGIYNKLGIGLLDPYRPLELYVPKAGKGTIDSPEEGFNKADLMVTGVYSVNEEIDNKYVFVPLELAQRMLEFAPNQYTALEFKLKPGADEAAVINNVKGIFRGKLGVKTRAQLNDSLYKMLNAENLVTYLFCSLVVVLTLFCLAGALIMLILDKKENIKTLYNLGAEVRGLRRIFFLQGIFITAIGAILGLGLGVVIVLLQQTQQLVMITPTMAYPTHITLFNIGVVLATIFGLGIIASYIASTRVGKTLLENS
jgi:lipoprotein-releasing system permease protein